MRLLCLFFPRLGVQLAREKDPLLAGSPIALVTGQGDAALVAVPSVEATAAGIEPGMAAARARASLPGLAFLPDNAGACLGTLERIAAILRARTTPDVAIMSRDAIVLSLAALDDRFVDESHAAESIARLARAWSGLDIRAGVAATPDTALHAARSARRFAAICPGDDPASALAAPPAELTARTSWGPALGAIAAADRFASLLGRLQPALDGYGLSFRRLHLSIERAGRTDSCLLQAEEPLHTADEAVLLVRSRLGRGALDGATGISIRLRGIGPAVRVAPWRPAPSTVRPLPRTQRHGLQLAS